MPMYGQRLRSMDADAELSLPIPGLLGRTFRAIHQDFSQSRPSQGSYPPSLVDILVGGDAPGGVDSRLAATINLSKESSS